MNISSLVLAIFQKSFLPFLVVIIMGAIFVFLNKKSDSKDEQSNTSDDYKHYVKKNYLMSEAEHNFFKVLQEAVEDKYYIIPQVQLSKIVEVNKYEYQKRKYFNRIDRKSVDFVLFNKEHFTPEIVVELDETSHLLPENEKKDIFKDNIFNNVGIKIVRIKTAYEYDLQEITRSLLIP